MKGTLFLVTRGWRTNKLRTALSILGIALGVAVVTGIHVMDHNTSPGRLRAANPAHGRVDFELVPKDRAAPLDVLAERLRAQSDIAAVGLVRSASVELTHAAASLGVVRCFGLAPRCPRRPSATTSSRAVASSRRSTATAPCCSAPSWRTRPASPSTTTRARSGERPGRDALQGRPPRTGARRGHGART